MTDSMPYKSSRSDSQVILALARKQLSTSFPDLNLHDDILKTLLTKCWDIDPYLRPSARECLSYLPKPVSNEFGPQRTAAAMRTKQLWRTG